MEDFDAPSHCWPSVELVSQVKIAPDFASGRRVVARAVWNALAAFSSAAIELEGGYEYVARRDGTLTPFFAASLSASLQIESDAMVSFGRLVVRDLKNELGHTGVPYGPDDPHGAYLALDSQGQLYAQVDLPGHPRRRFIGVAVPAARAA